MKKERSVQTLRDDKGTLNIDTKDESGGDWPCYYMQCLGACLRRAALCSLHHNNFERGFTYELMFPSLI